MTTAIVILFLIRLIIRLVRRHKQKKPREREEAQNAPILRGEAVPPVP